MSDNNTYNPMMQLVEDSQIAWHINRSITGTQGVTNGHIW
jgi:hypothetical protein